MRLRQFHVEDRTVTNSGTRAAHKKLKKYWAALRTQKILKKKLSPVYRFPGNHRLFWNWILTRIPSQFQYAEFGHGYPLFINKKLILPISSHRKVPSPFELLSSSSHPLSSVSGCSGAEVSCRCDLCRRLCNRLVFSRTVTHTKNAHLSGHCALARTGSQVQLTCPGRGVCLRRALMVHAAGSVRVCCSQLNFR